MEHAAGLADERPHLREGIVKRAALVDDAVQTEFGRDFHLLPENVRLFLLVTRIIGGGGFRLLAWQVMIIQTRFADGDDFGMPGKFAQGGADIFRRSQRFGGMPADNGIDTRKFFSKVDGAFTTGETGPDGNDFCDASGLRARNNFRQIRRVVGIIQMRVRVEEEGHDNLWLGG